MSVAFAIELIDIHKRFGTVYANRGVNLQIRKGSIHGIVGENGAGKSTLMSILYGYYAATSGTIMVDGREAHMRSSRDAIALGIGMVHQHFMLVESLTVLENILLGSEGGFWLKGGMEKLRARLADLGKTYGLEVDPDACVADIGVGQRQRVEILKALVRGAKVLILDEPTAVLTPTEADSLFDMLRVLRDEGKTIVLITHKLREIMHATDHVSVMRRGEMVAHFETASTSVEQLADAMVGRKVSLTVARAPAHEGRVLLEAHDLVVRDALGVARVDHVSLTVRAGEIVGIAGVAGNGQSQLLEAIAGMQRLASGSIVLDGQEIDTETSNPRKMRELGLMHVPEDRHRHGLVMSFEACESGILGFQHDEEYGRTLLDRAAVESGLARDMETYDIRPRDPRLTTHSFSGGNQQKIVLAREIERGPKVLLVGQPTRGVDIGAIEFIHKRIMALRDAGKAILLVSVELDEIMALSDRILVMCDGRITGERRPDQTNSRDLGLLMAGISDKAA